VTGFDTIRTLQGEALRSALQRLYMGLFADPDSIPDYLADTCVQRVGSKALDYTQINRHVRHVRARVKHIQYEVADAVADNDTIADRHIVELTLHDGRTAALEVFCFLHFVNGKIVEIFECSQVLKGDQALGVLATAVE